MKTLVLQIARMPYLVFSFQSNFSRLQVNCEAHAIVISQQISRLRGQLLDVDLLYYVAQFLTWLKLTLKPFYSTKYPVVIDCESVPACGLLPRLLGVLSAILILSALATTFTYRQIIKAHRLAPIHR